MAKLVFFAAAWVQGLASRTEGALMLQIGEHIQVDSNRMEYLNNVKQQILSFADNGVPETTWFVLDNVSTMLTAQVLPSILAEKTNHKTNHGIMYAEFATASTNYEAHITAATTYLDDEVAEKKGLHSRCRSTESEIYGRKQTCDAERRTAQADYTEDEGTVRGLSQGAGVCVEANFNWRDVPVTSAAKLNQMSAGANEYAVAIGEVIKTRAILVAKIGECNGISGNLDDIKDGCDTDQQVFETASCSYSSKVTTAASTYNTRYNEVKVGFEALFKGWEDQSTDRETQCKLVKTLVCYISALRTNDDSTPLAAAVGECDGERDDHNCDDVIFTHDKSPAADIVADAPSSPCDADFTYMATWPTGTAAATCSACS